MGTADKQGSAYLRSCVARGLQTFQSRSEDCRFAELPKEVREGFLNGVSGKLTFRQGLYTYQSEWKGALSWLRERLNEAPSEKIRVALEELVSPTVCQRVQRTASAF